MVYNAVDWAHTTGAVSPCVIESDNIILESHIPMWQEVKDKVKDNGPIQPVKLLRNGTQVFYSS